MLKLSLTQRFWKIFSTIWLWKISLWPLNYEHILASVVRFFVPWFGQVHYGITAGKKNAVVFFQFEYEEFSAYVHFFRFRPQISFLGKFGPKNQNCQFILKFGTWINSNMQNSMAMFNFSAFYWTYPFWANLVQLIKIVRLNWNLVLEFNGDVHFLGFGPKYLI